MYVIHRIRLITPHWGAPRFKMAEVDRVLLILTEKKRADKKIFQPEQTATRYIQFRKFVQERSDPD